MTKKSRLRVQKEKRGRRVIKLLLLSVLLILLGYLLDEQFEIVKVGKDYYSQIKKRISPENFVRGTIYDRNLKQLAVTMERVSVYVRTREIDSIAETAMLLSPVLQLDAETFQDQLESGVMRLWVAGDISQEQEESIKQLGLSGVYLQRDSKRYYPNASAAAHLVGYVEDGFGLSGVEFYYDRILASRKLQQQKEQKPLSSAQDLVLTIDFKIQSILEAIVKEIAEKKNATRVIAYLQESRNGEIIAGAHLPSFDPNNFTKYSHDVIGNLFLEPIYLPHKFRSLLRDAALLYAKQSKGEFSSAWSLIPPDTDLGSQLQLWSGIGFDSEVTVDFAAGSAVTGGNLSTISVASAYPEEYGTAPEMLSPMQLLNGFTILLGNGKKVQPSVVQKIYDIETDLEIDLSSVLEKFPNSDKGAAYYLNDLDNLFDSQAERIDSTATYVKDSIVLNGGGAAHISTKLNTLMLVQIPAGSDELFLLILVQEDPELVKNKAVEKLSIEGVVDRKAERISVLQQVALSVADVVEPELSEDGNYQGDQRLFQPLGSGNSGGNKKELDLSVMPDLEGLSLRKSLRLLYGIPLEIKIEGTGRVVKQSPLPGTPLKGVGVCELILASKEKEMYDELATEADNQ